MSLQQIRNDLKGLKETFRPRNAFENIIIYDPVKGIPEAFLKGDVVQIFIPDNSRDSQRFLRN